MFPLRYLAYAVLCLFAFGFMAVVANLVGTVASVATAPGRVVSKTLETGNVIASYERFRDLNAVFTARVAQVRQEKTFLEAETDPVERRRLRVEMAAVQQSCRDIAARYAADASKMNRAIFRADAPESLNPTLCE